MPPLAVPTADEIVEADEPPAVTVPPKAYIWNWPLLDPPVPVRVPPLRVTAPRVLKAVPLFVTVPPLLMTNVETIVLAEPPITSPASNRSVPALFTVILRATWVFPKAPLTGLVELLPRAAASVPWLTAKEPVKVFAPEKVWVAVPVLIAFTSLAPAVSPSWITPEKMVLVPRAPIVYVSPMLLEPPVPMLSVPLPLSAPSAQLPPLRDDMKPSTLKMVLSPPFTQVVALFRSAMVEPARTLTVPRKSVNCLVVLLKLTGFPLIKRVWSAVPVLLLP